MYRIPARPSFIPVGSLHPVVSLAFKATTRMPSGITLTVGGAKAIRFFDELSGEQRIRRERSGGYLEIAFTPQRKDDLSARAEWRSRFALRSGISGAVSVPEAATPPSPRHLPAPATANPAAA